jgi:hypothetical protein
VVDQDLVVIFAGIFATTVGYQLSRALGRRMERRTLDREDLAELRQHFETIEQAVDSIAIEVERISEAQRFTAKIMAERSEGLVTSGPDASPLAHREPDVPRRSRDETRKD